MPDPIRQEVRFEAEDAKRQAEEFAREQQKIADATREAGREADRTADAIDQESNSTRRATEATHDKNASLGDALRLWSTLLATSASIGAFFDMITDKAKESAKALADVGAGIGGLAANVGGGTADALFAEITSAAADRQLGVRGRTGLVDFMARATDIRANMSFEEMRELTSVGADLARATDVGGGTGFDVIQALSSSFDIGDREAANMAAGLISSGFDPQTIQDLALRGGDPRFLALALAARDQGLDTGVGGRQLNSLLSSLTRVDASGEVPAEMAAMGITGDMSGFERFQRAAQMRQSGEISEGQFYALTGGQQTAALVRPLMRALASPNALDDAMGELGAGGVMDELIGRRLDSSFYRAMEERNTTELLSQVRRETSSLSGFGRRTAQMDAALEDVGMDGWFLRPFRSLAAGVEYAVGGEAGVDDYRRGAIEEIQERVGTRERGPIRSGGIAGAIINYNNCTFNGAPAPHQDSGRTLQE